MRIKHIKIKQGPQGISFGLFLIILLALGLIAYPLYSVGTRNPQQTNNISTPGKPRTDAPIIQESVLPAIKEINKEEYLNKIGGEFFTNESRVYSEEIYDVLSETGYFNDVDFVQTMLYVGLHESHWSPGTISGFEVGTGKEHPTGVFQFLQSTFNTVSDGDIYNIEDQIKAYITMHERDRLGEFHVLYVCNYDFCFK